MTSENLLPQFQANIWTAQQAFSLFGAQIGLRMTIIDYTGNGDLLVHSPIKPKPELITAIKRLGTVKFIVAPNRWHHLYVSPFRAQYPDAKLLCAPGLETKRSDIHFDNVISENTVYPWSTSLKHHLVKGAPLLNEVVFYHEQSKTLLVTDLGTHICKGNFWTRFFFKLIGNYNRYGLAKLERAFFVRNKKAFRATVEKILEWDFRKILLSHGQPIESDAKAKLEHAFR